ncbi:uncharacterized protein LOC117765239 isoform X1 [Hippoglossus hippoglossus]|uniref:uncharacterized protein LOC117765239 isoform X1 n=2 Tax=Hippoglossus hippoglossus TaxID=8267 RepID=UPI00148DF5BF|nr:uncharacterized protein LOC117765239 isoform X1 [Hippoglossus hippoglossus]
MAARVAAVVLLLLGLCSGSGPASGPDPERGRIQLLRVQSLASQPRYGDCWARALQHLDTRCKDMTSESQRWIALRFTHCHLSSSGRDFPSCPEGSDVSSCTGGMDVAAFNAFTEFFTHTHAICHFLQSDAWQSRAEDAMYRLTESSAGVAEQLQSTRQMAEELIEAQSAALQAQQEILNNGEELRVTLQDSTQGLRAVFSELSSVSREQQVALSELFNRVTFLQSFLLMETHSLSSCCYNAAALCTCFLLTSTQRSSRARLVLLSLVCLNFYLEMKIYQFVMNTDHPEHKHMELLSVYVGVLRRLMACVGVCLLLYVCVRYRDPVQQSLQLLQQLRETQHGLQEALQRAERLGETRTTTMTGENRGKCREAEDGRDEDDVSDLSLSLYVLQEDEDESASTNGSHLSHLSHSGRRMADVTMLPYTTHNASVSPARRCRHPPSSPLVYSILVEDKQPRYSLRSRRSETR